MWPYREISVGTPDLQLSQIQKGDVTQKRVMSAHMSDSDITYTPVYTNMAHQYAFGYNFTQLWSVYPITQLLIL